MARTSDAVARQQGRAYKLHLQDEAAIREEKKKRERLRRRVEGQAFAYKVHVEATELEKELEERRCKLCDLLQAEAWGLGHTNWFERRCGRCWTQQADALAAVRHVQLGTAGASADGQPELSHPAVQRRGRQGSRPRVRFATDGADDAEAEGSAGSPASGPLAEVPLDRIDDVVDALRARDADQLMQLVDARVLERLLAPDGGLVCSAGASEPQLGLAPPPEHPEGGYYYHDAVLEGLGGDAGSVARAEEPGGDGAGSDSEGPAASSAVADIDSGSEAGKALRRPKPGHDNRGVRRVKFAHDHALRQQGLPDKGHMEQGQREQRAPQPGAAEAAPPIFDAVGRWEAHYTAGELGLEPEDGRNEPGGSEAAAAAGPRALTGTAPAPAVGAAGYRPEQRPLPSKPRRLPTGTEDIESALREAEQQIVFGQTQRQRSEALFYSHQLRSALADLRLLDRKARKAEAVHRHGVRLDTRDEEGVARIIREGRREKVPTPDELRRIVQPDSFYVDPPKRAPCWLEHIHPARPDPAKAVDPMAWKPPSGKVPPPRHTAGMQSAGDWSEYRYDWDLANIRSMPVDDYLTVIRREKEYRRAWAGLQTRAHALAGTTLTPAWADASGVRPASAAEPLETAD